MLFCIGDFKNTTEWKLETQILVYSTSTLQFLILKVVLLSKACPLPSQNHIHINYYSYKTGWVKTGGVSKYLGVANAPCGPPLVAPMQRLLMTIHKCTRARQVFGLSERMTLKSKIRIFLIAS